MTTDVYRIDLEEAVGSGRVPPGTRPEQARDELLPMLRERMAHFHFRVFIEPRDATDFTVSCTPFSDSSYRWAGPSDNFP